MVYKVSVTFTTNQPINSLTIKRDSFSETIYSPFGNIINIPGSDISTNAYRFTFEGEDTAYSASLMQIPGSEWDAGESVYLSAYKYKPTNIPTIANTGTLTPKNYISPVSELYISNTTYQNCKNIISVDLHNIPWVNNSMSHAFSACTNLIHINNISNTVTDMSRAFLSCSNLVNAPVIPNSVTDMVWTFRACVNLVNAPTIPDSVTNMVYTFHSCNSLVNAPIIGNGVTNMQMAFYGSSNVQGNIYIYSNQVADAGSCFTVIPTKNAKIKNVYIPFTYENGEYTQTYNSFINAGYKINGSSYNVYLKDINNNYFTLSVNPTPSDATVTLTQG